MNAASVHLRSSIFVAVFSLPAAALAQEGGGIGGLFRDIANGIKEGVRGGARSAEANAGLGSGNKLVAYHVDQAQSGEYCSEIVEPNGNREFTPRLSQFGVVVPNTNGGWRVQVNAITQTSRATTINGLQTLTDAARAQDCIALKQQGRLIEVTAQTVAANGQSGIGNGQAPARTARYSVYQDGLCMIKIDRENNNYRTVNASYLGAMAAGILAPVDTPTNAPKYQALQRACAARHPNAQLVDSNDNPVNLSAPPTQPGATTAPRPVQPAPAASANARQPPQANYNANGASQVPPGYEDVQKNVYDSVMKKMQEQGYGQTPSNRE